MKLFISILLLIFFTISTFGQENNINRLVGFACGEAGNPTPLVENITVLIKEKKYSEILSFLNSKNSGKIYLAIIVLERLDKKKSYLLNDKQKTIISHLKSSNILVLNCLGCFKEINSMKEMFKKEDFIGEKYWLDEMFSEN